MARLRSEHVSLPSTTRFSSNLRVRRLRGATELDMASPLQYFQQSPVRGQLEPPDATTRPGWRYLQCTDTPNELKGTKSPIFSLTTTDPGIPVLLPPRASQVYAYLLSQEQVELTRGSEASWERLMHVRHLKDRMISEPYECSLPLRVCFNSGHR